MTELPRAMLIDMDDTILSAYGRPEIAWNNVAAEFADEFAPLSPQQVAAAVLDFARRFWSTAEPAWRLKLAEARRQTVQGGFAALAADGHGARCRLISRSGSPTASRPFAKKRCSCSRARMTRSMR